MNKEMGIQRSKVASSHSTGRGTRKLGRDVGKETEDEGSFN